MTKMLSLWVALLLAACGASPQLLAAPPIPTTPPQTDPPSATAEASATAEGRPVEEARQSYMGRVVAAPMSFHGAGWLIRDERNREEATDRVLKELALTKGMVVCDMGCGNGYYTLPIARRVAPTGRVLAVDIQPEMLQMLRARADRARLDVVEPILGEIDDPKLPIGEVDLVLMVDVYHEFSHPESMLWSVRRSLKPTGVVALLEYREEDPNVPIKRLHKMSKSQIMKEYEANGFKLVRESDELPWQHLMYFARDDSPLEAIEPVVWKP